MNDLENEVKQSIGIMARWFAENEAAIIDFIIHLALACIILFVGMLVARLISNTVNRVSQARGLDVTVSQFLSSLVRYAILTVAIIAAMANVGIQTTSFIAVLGAAGLAVGLALQGSLSNFAAGVLLVMFRPFRVGEYVDLGGAEGNILSIQIFSTTLSTADGKLVVIPNGKIISGNIINFTREPNRRLQIMVSVSYQSDIDQVKKVLGDVINADPRILKDLGITIRLNEMAASSLNFVVRVWTTNADYGLVNFDLLEGFKKALDSAGIGLPYPQMDVHLYQTKPNNSSID